MSLPMGLCSDRKRGLTPLCFFKKNQNHQNSTMFDKSVSVFPTASGCSAGILNHKETKPHPLFPQTASFHSKSRFTLETLLVGGFLGSKSQGPSANTPPIVWDLICQASSMFQAAMMPLTSGKQCDFISVQSPPKKKFAKEENPSSLEKVDTIEFPSVIQEQSSAVEVPKQSYAEVAKAPSCKPFRPDRCASSKDNTTSRRASGNNRRRSQAGQRRSSRRKTSRQDSRECSSQQTTEVISSSSSPGCHLESWKDPQLIQLEKNFSQFNRVSGKNFKLGERHSKPSSNSHRKDFKSESNSESHNRRRRHPNYRSHCDNKRGTQAKKFDCDIDMINWRTGEPIGSKMGSQHVSDTKGENFSNQYTVCDGVTSLHENVDDCTGAIRKHDFSPCDSVGWPELQNTSSPKCRRRSLSSECSVDSEDSFIVFQSGAPSDSSSDLASDWSDCDSDDSYESDDDSSDEMDHCDGLSPSSQRLKEVNDRWVKECTALDSFADCAVLPNGISCDVERKVRFEEAKPVVHRMLAWDFAYRSSRVGPWEEMARDRARFKTRIQQFEGIISPVLASDHRNKIWKRFETL